MANAEATLLPTLSATSSANTLLQYPDGTIASQLLAELDSRGCIAIPNLQAPDLANSIYPLFCAPNFPNLTKAEYAYIEPALRLASHFIAEEAMMQFWIRVQHGQVTLEWRSGEEVRYIGHLEEGNAMERARNKRETQNALGKIARGLKVVGMTEDMMEENAKAFGKAFLQQDKKKGKRKTDEVANYRIGLHPDVLQYIRENSGRSKGDLIADEICDVVRFFFLLARVLVRETVHFFYHHTHQGSEFGQIPFWSLEEQELNEKADLAASWEMFAYACKVQQWRATKVVDPNLKQKQKIVADNARSIFLHTSHTIEGGVDQILTHTTVLPMTWIHSWFLQSTWNAIHKFGRVEGRPELGSAPVLLGVDINGLEDVDGNTNFEWMTEKYSHKELAEHGGFNTTDDDEVEWLYGRLEESNEGTYF